MRERDEQYFETLERELDEAMRVAQRARERGGDPTPDVEIPTARDMADRVENILGIEGVAQRVRELEGEMSREEAALELVEDFVDGTVGDYDTRAGKVEGAVRTAVALLTEGVVAAPIEGIDRVELLENDDGTEFINVYYAGPIRSAGGTAQALSVLVADYARALLGIEQYNARDDEIGRYAEEIELYDKDTGLQYSPKEKETKFIAEHMPIMLDGEATGDEEVSGYRDLERVDSNSPRGGMCLVLAEGIALKAPKIQRYTRNLDEVEWPWLQDLIDGTIGDGDGNEDSESGDDTNHDEDTTEDGGDDSDGPPRADPEKKYLRDLIAGRPVFSHPSKSGGFRLRYGRARNHGFATAGVHPATMHLVDDFLATGTQIKTERPGKAAGVVPVDSIEGPTVKLANGDVRRIDDAEEALQVRNGVEKILDLGEYLVNYGEFVENNHPLAPASYTVEWWEQDFGAAGADVQAMRDDPAIDLEDPAPADALDWVREYDVPLHPKYTYLWHDLSVKQLGALAGAIEDGEIATADGAVVTESTATDGDLVVPRTETVRTAFERLLIEHTQTDDRIVVPEWRPLIRTLGFSNALERDWTLSDLSDHARTYGDSESSDAIGYVDDELADNAGRNAIKALNEIAPFAVRERAPTRIGNRMGRPEKSERRDLSPAVHTLFPIGEAGGSQRDVAEAATHSESMSDTPGRIEAEVARRRCPACGTEHYDTRCPACGEISETVYRCPDCDRDIEPDPSGRAECSHCETLATPTQTVEIDINSVYREALESVGERETAFETLKAVKGLTSKEKLPEPMEKGVLRAKHDVSAFKDGTVRYDMTDLPVTALRPSELDVDPERLRALGYETDIHGAPLTHEDQLFELKVQDIVLSEGAAQHMLQTAAFVDDLLDQYYGLDRYYEFDDRDDLVGELVFGMAPHTSAATVGRVIGFTTAAVGYAHPYFHAAKRRNCFHPETKLWYEDEHGTCHHDPIETVVEDRLDPETAHEDDFGTLVAELSGDVFVPSLDADGRIVRQPVEAVSRHPAPDHMVRIETDSGRELTVTPDHDMQVFDGDGLDVTVASELTETDHLVVPAHLDPLDNSAATELDKHTAATLGSRIGTTAADTDGPATVPERVFDAPTDVIAAFLGGYLDGGGTERVPSGLAVPAPSRELKEDLLALSTRAGITASAARADDAYVVRFQPEDADRLLGTARRHSQQFQSVSPPSDTDWRRVSDGGNGEYVADGVASVEYAESDIEHTYCLTVAGTHSLVANDTAQKQCDGDEDCVMLLMDGLLNFSKSYLPDKRGGRMDAPLVMSSRIDPSEIDDEAHNVDIMESYPRAFYEATRDLADPEAVAEHMTIAEETLGTDQEYTGFKHTHDTTNIAAGPELSAYKTLGSMEEKMDAQLSLSRKLRAVVESDVAERIIEYHFLPDLIGNLRAFSRQEVRCLDCGEKYRRMPLTGDCRECGGRVNLTVHEGSVNKYIDTALRVAEEFGARDYTKQRLRILERKIESIFEDDHNKPTSLGDYM